MRNLIRGRAILLAGCAAAATFSGVANAQTNPERGSSVPEQASETAAPASADTNEVIVTAQRRAERAVNVPIAISSVSGEALTTANVTDYNDLGRLVPGVVIGRTGGFAQPSIRGITTQASGAGGENNVATYVDGFYRPFQGSLLMDLDNITRIDVLRGPQGTLFGRNATGGAIQITTQEPTRDFRGRAAIQFARFNDLRLSADVSGPITDNLLFAVSGYVRRSDNYYTDFASGRPSAPIDNYGLGARLRFQPTENLMIDLLYEHRRRSDGSPFQYQFVEYQAARTAPYSPTTFTSTERNVTSLSQPVQVLNNFSSYGAHISLGTSIGTLNSYTSYQTNDTITNFDYDGSREYFQQINQREGGHAFQQEVNLVSNSGGAVDYAVGLYYYNLFDNYDYFFGYFSRAPGFVGVTPSDPGSGATRVWPAGTPAISARSGAAYADVTWHIGERLHLTGGLRYTTERQRVTGNDAARTVRSATFNSLTPRAVIRYELDRVSNVYASFSQGFKSGTFNIFAAPFDPVRPERLTAYELGYKSVRGAWNLDANVYYYDYTDLQVQTIITDIGGSPRLQTSNAARAETYGLEVQLAVEPVNRLHFRFSGAYSHARYTRYDTFAPALPNIVTGRQTTTCAPPATPCRDDLSGQQLLKAPDWTANLGADYTWRLGGGWLTASTNIAYTSSFSPTSPDHDLDPSRVVNNIIQPSTSGRRYATPARTLVSFNLRYQATPNFAISAFLNNAFDAEYLIVSSGNGNGVFRQWGEPRVFGGRMELTF